MVSSTASPSRDSSNTAPPRRGPSRTSGPRYERHHHGILGPTERDRRDALRPDRDEFLQRARRDFEQQKLAASRGDTTRRTKLPPPSPGASARKPYGGEPIRLRNLYHSCLDSEARSAEEYDRRARESLEASARAAFYRSRTVEVSHMDTHLSKAQILEVLQGIVREIEPRAVEAGRYFLVYHPEGSREHEVIRIDSGRIVALKDQHTDRFSLPPGG